MTLEILRVFEIHYRNIILVAYLSCPTFMPDILSSLLVVSSFLLCCNMQIIPSYLYANETIFWPKATNTQTEREREKEVGEGVETINMAKLATRRRSSRVQITQQAEANGSD